MRPTTDAPARRGFTLSELLVAVAAVVLITLGVASVFQSSSQTVRIGRSRAELDTLASAIERVMRDDFENINRDGYMVIRNRRITKGGESRRADEMAFFVNGNFTTAQFSQSGLGGGVGIQVQSRVARVYYGHGVQLGGLVPWKRGDGPYDVSGLQSALEDNALWRSGGLNASPNRWAYMRQPLVLTYSPVSSGGDRQFVRNPFHAFDVGTGVADGVPLASGLVDIAATDMGALSSYPLTQTADFLNPDSMDMALLTWAGEERDRQMIMRMAQLLPHDWSADDTPHSDWVSPENWTSGGVSWRTEIAPTGMSRSELMLTRSTLAVGVTSCAIEWSYDGVQWFSLDSRINNNTELTYPHHLYDKEGRPIDSGIVVPLDRLTVPNPVGDATAEYTANGLAFSERLFGFGLQSLNYLEMPSWWKAGLSAGIGVRVRNTEIPDPADVLAGVEFDPAFFDPLNEGAVDTTADEWRLSSNDLLPDRMPIPLPRLVRVRLTLSDTRGEFSDIPYTFTFELPQPPQLRQTDPGIPTLGWPVQSGGF